MNLKSAKPYREKESMLTIAYVSLGDLSTEFNNGVVIRKYLIILDFNSPLMDLPFVYSNK